MHPSPSTARLARLILSVACVVSGHTAVAQQATDARPLELRRIMQELGTSMQATVDAIAREDWARVANIAPRIASHPEPPTEEKVRIITLMGAEAGRFRGFDQQSHDAARLMGQAAEKRDAEGVIAAFAKVQGACLGCHQNYRQKFLDHFYGKR
jgi:hypothetical protein